MDPDEES